MYDLPGLPYGSFEFAQQRLSSICGISHVAVRAEKIKARQQGKWKGLQKKHSRIYIYIIFFFWITFMLLFEVLHTSQFMSS